MAVPLNRRDGSFFGTLCALDPLPSTLSEDDFAVFHLLAQLIAHELEADERRQQREAEVRSLEDFASIAAHDLRQPLTSLYTRAQLLARHARRDTPAEQVIAEADELVKQARRAVLLSNTLLDMAQIEASDLTLERAECDLASLARDALEDAQGAFPEQSFRSHLPDTLPIIADTQRLGQVIRNLLDNAAKYSPDHRGPIVLTVAEPGPEQPDEVYIRVEDSGIGVPAEQLARLFTRHYRATNALDHSISGSGLGLYIVQRIVTAHGGRIWAERAPTGGLAVTVALPCDGSG
jgi:signal transduction histidine kinase